MYMYLLYYYLNVNLKCCCVFKPGIFFSAEIVRPEYYLILFGHALFPVILLFNLFFWFRLNPDLILSITIDRDRN